MVANGRYTCRDCVTFDIEDEEQMAKAVRPEPDYMEYLEEKMEEKTEGEE